MLQSNALTEMEYKPYSLRRGGATDLWTRAGNLDRLVVRGRWGNAITARQYVNEAAAALATVRLPKATRFALEHHAAFYMAVTE